MLKDEPALCAIESDLAVLPSFPERIPAGKNDPNQPLVKPGSLGPFHGVGDTKQKKSERTLPSALALLR
jgi:hypothetical protein